MGEGRFFFQNSVTIVEYLSTYAMIQLFSQKINVMILLLLLCIWEKKSLAPKVC